MRIFLIKLSLLSLVLPVFFSCREARFDGSGFRPGGVYRGRLADGRTLFAVRSADSLRVSGYGFVYDGGAEVAPVGFSVDSTGAVALRAEAGQRLQGLRMRRMWGGRWVLAVPRGNGAGWGKQRVRLEFFYALDDGSRYALPYKQELYGRMTEHPDVEYGHAVGYYSSQPTGSIPHGDREQLRHLIVKDLARSMARRADMPLCLDVYEPEGGAVSPRPLVVFLHGGAFLFGDKRNDLQRTFTEHLVRRGYVVASVNYRLGISFGGLFSVERTVYRGVQDTRAALDYLITHAGEYRIDPQQIYLSGSSAGAIIALTTTFMDADEVFDSVERRIRRDDLGVLGRAANSESEKYRIAGVVSMWGGLIEPQVITRRDAHVPVLLFHGTADDIVPCESGLPFQVGLDSKLYDRLSESWQLYGSAALYRHMRGLNMPVEYVPFPDYGHEPQLSEDGSVNANMDTILARTDRFLYAHVSEHFAPCAIGQVPGGVTYRLEGKCRPVAWMADGGLVVDVADGKRSATVAWFAGAERRQVRVVVESPGGVYFEKVAACG